MTNLHNTGHMSSQILNSVVNLIDLSVQRAAWKGAEIAHIGQLREIFVEATKAAAAAEKEIKQQIEKRNEEDEESQEDDDSFVQDD